ncbi:MAG: ribose 5-phosphate isomerase A [Planctomycetota bacterium]
MINAKQAAGRRAAEFVEEGMTIGLGTGTTVFYTLEALAERVKDGLNIRGVPTSIDTEEKAREFGIPLVTLEEVHELDLTIDGADEIDGNFDMIKGGGGALLREKVVARASKRVVIVAGADKVVDRLGIKFLLPIEVVPFARHVIVRELKELGGIPNLRLADQGIVYLTDNGNEILDTHFQAGIDDPAALEIRLASIPGVVESGIFVGLANVLVVGDDQGHASVESRE